MRHSILAALLVVAVATALGATVFREEVAAAAATLNVVVTNDATHPVPVHEQIETQLLLDREFTDGQRETIDVAAYKTIHLDFDLTNGTCASSGASLLAVEATRFLERARIGADEACTGGFTGKTIEMPGRSLTLIVHAVPGDTWRVVVFGRAN
jgi:hypothetical protein